MFFSPRPGDLKPAELTLFQAQPDDARAEAEAAISCLEQAPFHAHKTEELAKALHLAARAHEALGQRKEALLSVQRALSILEPEYQKRPRALEKIMKKMLATRERLGAEHPGAQAQPNQAPEPSS